VTRYRAAVIGLSGIGAGAPPGTARHPELGVPWPHSHVPSYAVLPNVELVAACDLKAELLDQFHANYRPVWPNAKTYTDYRELLERERIDLLSVVTSDHRHAQIVVDAADAGVKGILCEKPIATTLADADRMIEACERRRVVLSINHSRRWRLVWHAAHAQLGDGGLGAVRRVVGSTGGPRAMLFRNGTHLIDTICWFATAGGQGQAGSEPAWVVGVLDEEHADYGPRYAGDGGRDPALDPGGSALVHFQNGVRAFVNCSKRTAARLELDVFCERGQVRVDDASAEVWAPAGGGREPARRPLAVPHTERGDTPAAIAGVIHAIERGGETLSPPREARKALAIILAILQSSAAGNAPVSFPVGDA
jgi:predicted dehydrogenase